MAILTCDLCEQRVDFPVLANGKTFCCYGCRDLWQVLGEDELTQLKHNPGIDWAGVRNSTVARNVEMTTAEAPMTVNFRLSRLWCASCGLLIQHVVNRLPGVVESEVSYAAQSLHVQFDPNLTPSSKICETVSGLGYGIQSDASKSSDESESEHRLVWRLAVSAALSLVLMMISVPVWFGYLPELPDGLGLLLSVLLWALTTPIVFWAGWPFTKGAWTSIRHGVATMDLLVSIASFAAYGYSVANVLNNGVYLYFDTCGFLVTFLLLGRLLETGTRQRALSVTRNLSRLSVSEARMLRESGEETVSIQALRPGDRVVVLSGERIPVDGTICEGTSEIDESFLTGEAVYAEKHPGDHVYAGTTNYSGRLIISVLRDASDTVLAQTMQLVRDTEAQGTVYKRLTERVLRVFIPGIMVISVSTFGLWEWITPIGTSSAVLRAIATLVIACPCALSVAAPVASQCAVQVLGRQGVLLRSDEAIERCARITAVVFDKTGTLTQGLVRLTQCYPDDPKTLQWAASVESASEHPFGRAVVEAARSMELSLLPVSDFAARHGEGVSATVNGHHISIRRYVDEPLTMDLERAAKQLVSDGQSLSIVWVDGNPRAVLAFADTVRADARETMNSLQSSGVDVHMATGDRDEPARQIAQSMGIATWRSGLTPVEKSEYIRSLQSQGLKVAYVGDGVNDAAALIQSDLGIAMGSGTDIAAQAGHLVLMQSQLRTIPTVLNTGRRAVSIIRQNLVWALLYNFGALVAAIAGFAGPAVAAAAMALSSLFVLGNALRLLGSKPVAYGRKVSLVVGSAVLLFVLVRFGI